MIKGYYDGSKDEKGTDFLTLGGISASDSTWPRIETAWGGVLAERGLDGWHSSDRRARMERNAFAGAAHALFDAIGKFREAPTFSYAVTVVLADHRRAIAEGVPLLTPEAICINWAFSHLVVPAKEDLPIVLYFDQGERFMHLIRRIWEKARGGRRQGRGWPWDVSQIERLDSRDVYALQAADLIAWSANRHERMRLARDEGDPGRVEAAEMTMISFFAARHLSKVYDYEALIALPEIYRRSLESNEPA